MGLRPSAPARAVRLNVPCAQGTCARPLHCTQKCPVCTRHMHSAVSLQHSQALLAVSSRSPTDEPEAGCAPCNTPRPRTPHNARQPNIRLKISSPSLEQNQSSHDSPASYPLAAVLRTLLCSLKKHHDGARVLLSSRCMECAVVASLDQ